MMVPSRLRALEIRPLPEEGDRYLVMDRLGLQPEALAVPTVFLLVAQEFDGIRDIETLARDFETRGIQVSPGNILNIAKQLGEASLLDDDRVSSLIAGLERDALSRPRPAKLIGRCFPSKPLQLTTWIDNLLVEAGGPLPDQRTPVPALVLPHIDPLKGGLTYVKGYRHLLAGPASDVYVILGIGHAGLRHGISLAPIDFETPIGLVETDAMICADLVTQCGDWIVADQLVQAQEHSIECQVVFMKHLLRHPFTIVPILTGFGPGDTGRMAGVLETLRRILEESGKTWTVLSSVDFSHLGPMYGDSTGATPLMELAAERDLKAIERLEAADDAGFWSAIHEDRNQTRICGYSSMWSMMQLVEPSSGTMIDYAEATMDGADSRVTFASMVFDV